MYAAADAAVALPSRIPVVIEILFVAIFHTTSSFQHRNRFEWNLATTIVLKMKIP
jgi:hypothetical protein